MRTCGGEIWLSIDNRLVDNGIASAAEMGVYSPENKWLIEGWGVEPDVEIDNMPYETFKGKDAQLKYAIDYLQKQIKANPLPVPKTPAYPDKSFDYMSSEEKIDLYIQNNMVSNGSARLVDKPLPATIYTNGGIYKGKKRKD